MGYSIWKIWENISYNPYAPWCWYIYLQNWVINFGANVGKYSSTMEHKGNKVDGYLVGGFNNLEKYES